MDDDSAPPSPSSLRAKLKNSLCSYYCFRHRQGHRRLPGSPPSGEKPTLLWLKSLAAPHGNGNSRHKRNSSEFRYDPLSYALNFEDGFDDDDEFPLRSFSSRLPPSRPAGIAAV